MCDFREKKLWCASAVSQRSYEYRVTRRRQGVGLEWCWTEGKKLKTLVRHWHKKWTVWVWRSFSALPPGRPGALPSLASAQQLALHLYPRSSDITWDSKEFYQNLKTKIHVKKRLFLHKTCNWELKRVIHCSLVVILLTFNKSTYIIYSTHKLKNTNFSLKHRKFIIVWHRT